MHLAKICRGTRIVSYPQGTNHDLEGGGKKRYNETPLALQICLRFMESVRARVLWDVMNRTCPVVFPFVRRLKIFQLPNQLQAMKSERQTSLVGYPPSFRQHDADCGW